MAFDYNKYHEEYRKANYDRIQVLLPKGGKAILAEAATKAGLSLNRWAMQTLMRAAERPNKNKEG